MLRSIGSTNADDVRRALVPRYTTFGSGNNKCAGADEIDLDQINSGFEVFALLATVSVAARLVLFIGRA